MTALRGWRESVPLQTALAALALAVVTVLWSLVTAFRVAPIPDPPPTAIASLESIRHPEARPSSNLEATIEGNVFSVDRTPPATAYRMPGDPDPAARPMAQPEKPIVLGTAVATDGRHFATVQMSNTSPTLVHVGDKVGEWTVRLIERGKIVLTTATGLRAEVTVAKTGF
ncbi:MAG TPA: hypothetical protein VIP11_08880 [Gemmatimonadaceae bacterium]